MSTREEAVLALTLAGQNDKAIAQRLGIGIESVRTYWSRIRAKFQVSTRSEAIMLATNIGLGGVFRAQETEIQRLIRSVQRERRFHETLTQRDDTLRELCNMFSGGVFAADAKGLCTYVNRAAASMLGEEPDALIGVGWLRLPWDAKSQSRLAKAMEECRHSGYHHGTYELNHRGRRNVVRVAVKALTRDGTTTGFVGTVDDLTEAASLREELSEATKFGECIARATDDIVYLYDLGTLTTIWVNQASEELFGMSSAEIREVGAGGMDRFIDRQDHEAIKELHRQYLALGDDETAALDFVAIDKGGAKVRLVGKSVVYRRDEFGVPRIMLGVLKVSP